MVFFWPWKGDDNSPASFEKILSNLSTKISKMNSRLDGFRQRSRRLKVLWTLYAGFTYLLYTVILTLVVGWRKWGLAEYTAVSGGPVIVYLVRLSFTTYYEYRSSSIQRQLLELQKQRDFTIEKLKAATKYNDTQVLLKKYGGTPAQKTKLAGPSEAKATSKQGDAPKAGRTTLTPPPTANIPGRNGPPTFANAPQHSSIPQAKSHLERGSYPVSEATLPTRGPQTPHFVSEEFAPNAFSATPQYLQAHERSRWYDRITDVLLGEDETLPRARLALICEKCRLVNGQAPPGVRRLEDIGRWRCGGCGTMNGEESEAKKVVASIKEQASSKVERFDEGENHKLETANSYINREDAPATREDGHESDITQYSSESSDSTQHTKGETAKVIEPENPRRRSTRTNRGGKKATWNGSHPIVISPNAQSSRNNQKV